MLLWKINNKRTNPKRPIKIVKSQKSETQKRLIGEIIFHAKMLRICKPSLLIGLYKNDNQHLCFLFWCDQQAQSTMKWTVSLIVKNSFCLENLSNEIKRSWPWVGLAQLHAY